MISNIYIPLKNVKTKKNIIIASGWKPGWSTDYVAVLLAKQFEAKEILNLSNISHIYDKDPKKFMDAKKLFEVSWKDYRKIIGDKWIPRLNSPFDPIASKEAEKSGVMVAVLKGTDLNNVENYLQGQAFKGTIIK